MTHLVTYLILIYIYISCSRYIRHLKNRLSLSLAVGVNKRVWFKTVLDSIINKHNNQLIPGTRYKRHQLDNNNFYDFLKQKTGLKHPELSFNSTSINVSSSHKLWRKTAFNNLNIGDTVLLRRSCNWKAKKTFLKSTTLGSYTKDLFTIKALRLKPNNRSFLVPTVELNEITGLFYPPDLLSVPKDIFKE